MCLSNLQLIHSHLFSSTSCWAFPPAQHVEKNMFCHICILFVKCSSDTREDACNYTTDWYNFSIDMGFCSCCQQIFHPFRQMIFPFRLWLPSNLVQARTSALLFEKFAPVTTSSNSMMENTRVSFRTLSSCLPLPAISHFPFNVGFNFLSTPCHYSMNHNVSGFEVPTSHLLVITQSH